MNLLTIAYANHRPETIRLSEPFIRQSQAVILEEPPSPHLPTMLDGSLPADEYLLEQDIEYPAFGIEQCRVLKMHHQSGVEIIQEEPYFEHLFMVQDFFADGKRPDQLDTSTVHYQVYLREKAATGRLIDYYKSVRHKDFRGIIEAVKLFARADADRFRLRDRLRAQAIVRQAMRFRRVCVEAGPMHLLLFRYLRSALPSDWSVHPVFVENQVLQKLGCRSGLYSPGDVLTAHYLLDHTTSADYQDLLSARALIFMKIIEKEEYSGWQNDFPHLRNDWRANQLVRQLSYQDCETLSAQTIGLSTAAALETVGDFCADAPGKQ
jgi:hypothetical protein